MASKWQIEKAAYNPTSGPATEKNIRIDGLAEKWQGSELAGRRDTILVMLKHDLGAAREILEMLNLRRTFQVDETYELTSTKPAKKWKG